MRERAICTSPDSLTSRSMMSARTRSIALAAASTSAGSSADAAEGADAAALAEASATTLSAEAASCEAGVVEAAGVAKRGSVTLVRFSRSASRTNATSSRSASSASNSVSDAGARFSPCISRDSMRCVSSPRRIAPAMRALPLNVWSVRRRCCAVVRSRGLRRQPRTCSPACGNSSDASSRKIASTCSSTSSRMPASGSVSVSKVSSGSAAGGGATSAGTSTSAATSGPSASWASLSPRSISSGASASTAGASGATSGAASVTGASGSGDGAASGVLSGFAAISAAMAAASAAATSASGDVRQFRRFVEQVFRRRFVGVDLDGGRKLRFRLCTRFRFGGFDMRALVAVGCFFRRRFGVDGGGADDVAAQRLEIARRGLGLGDVVRAGRRCGSRRRATQFTSAVTPAPRTGCAAEGSGAPRCCSAISACSSAFDSAAISGKPPVRWMPHSVWLARTMASDGAWRASNCSSDSSCSSVPTCCSASSHRIFHSGRRQPDVADGDFVVLRLVLRRRRGGGGSGGLGALGRRGFENGRGDAIVGVVRHGRTDACCRRRASGSARARPCPGAA